MAAHFVEIAQPTRAAQFAGRFQSQGLSGCESERQVDGFPFRRQVVPPHHGGAGFVVNVYICA
ncbi:MAG: hypothetical protein MUE63_12855 [Xanthomonadales bacterium]|jgi:hypothetical protein|nr:hypothetical protein [Xanthomonadales bacterium]